MKYNCVCFTLHRACNAECEMCCSSSSPKSKEKLQLDKVIKFIQSTKEIEEIEEVGITGGEPFLNFPALKEITYTSSLMGKKVSIMTNGYWAKDYETAYSMLSELKRRGLTSLGTSCDSFHQKYIPIENIKNLLRAANELKIPVGINLIYENNNSMGKLINEIQDEFIQQKLIPFQWMPVGRAKEYLDEKDIKKYKIPEILYCNNFSTFNIDYNKKIYPCCSPYVFSTDLEVGEYDNITCKEALLKLKNNRILSMLREKGFHYFLDLIRKNNINIDIPEFIESNCELCGKLFSEENMWKLYPYIYDEMEIESK